MRDSRDNRRPLIIAGPCSAESREQLLTTALELKELECVDFLRAGVWKPRTHPDSFEGVGEIGLEWLAEAKALTGLKCATEVASRRHVELASKSGVDMMWIGARTTVNPFLVQEIAEAAAECSAEVMVKNPMHPDIELWAGAVERLQKAGVERERILLAHRGFSTSSRWRYRNDPMWHLVLDMKRRFGDLRMICDPSHISGNRELIGEVAQTAANLNCDGLIIESHCNPQMALSDKEQQLRPEHLGQVLESIVWRALDSHNNDYLASMSQYRTEIDQIDRELFELLSRRMRISDQIGEIKRKNDVIILQSDRWQEIVSRVLSHAEKWQLSPKFLEAILEAIHIESIEHQNRIMKQ